MQFVMRVDAIVRDAGVKSADAREDGWGDDDDGAVMLAMREEVIERDPPLSAMGAATSVTGIVVCGVRETAISERRPLFTEKAGH